MNFQIRERDLDAIDTIFKELVSTPGSFISGKRVIEIVGDEQYAGIIWTMLISRGSAKAPKYHAHKYDLLATDLTNTHFVTKYYREHAQQTEIEKIKEEKEIEKLELEISDLKRNKWIAPTALIISILSILITILTFLCQEFL